MAEVIIVFLGYLVGSFVGAILLKISAKWVQKFDLTIGRSYKIMLVVNIINIVLGIVIVAIIAIMGINHLLPISGPEAISIASIIMIPVGFMVLSKLLSSRLKIPFSRGCLISLVMTAMVTGLSFAIRVVIFVTA